MHFGRNIITIFILEDKALFISLGDFNAIHVKPRAQEGKCEFPFGKFAGKYILNFIQK